MAEETHVTGYHILGAASGIFEPVAAECAEFLALLGWKPKR